MRKTIWGTPASQEDLEQLLMPLQKAAWVSRVTGLSASAISAGIRENRSPLPAPVELTVTGPDQAPARGRRWLIGLFARGSHCLSRAGKAVP